MYLTPAQILLSFTAIYLILKLLLKTIKLRQTLSSFGDNDIPKFILWIHPFRAAAFVFGAIYPFRGQIGCYYDEFSTYRKHKITVLPSATFWESTPAYWLADAEAIKIISNERRIFVKDVVAYEVVNIYGGNIIGSEGTEWKRHRAVARTAFNDANLSFVWAETIRVMNEWFKDIDNIITTSSSSNQTDTIHIDLRHTISRLTLLVISSAGFGRRVSWSEDTQDDLPPLAPHSQSQPHKIPFRLALSKTISSIHTRAIFPPWFYELTTSGGVYVPFITPYLRGVKLAFEHLRAHMEDVISGSRAALVDSQAGAGKGKVGESTGAGRDAALLRNLVEANLGVQGEEDATKEEKGLTDDELLSDTFVFLLAGHETSSHTLCFAIVLLALYPDIQQKVLEEATRLWPDGFPTSDAVSPYKTSAPELEYTTAVFHETLRLFPAVPRLAKDVLYDTTLPATKFTSNSDNTVDVVEDIVVNVKAGSIVIMDSFGLHYNPLYWGADASEFRPERFIDTDTYRWPRDAFASFSAGPRSCIGRRFSVSESICIIAGIVRRYEILVPQVLEGQSFKERKESLLRWVPGVTLTPTNANVRLRRRL